MKPIMIGLHGPTGVGKDEVYRILRDISPYETQRLAFGDALKHCVKMAFGLDDLWLQDDHKTAVHPYWGITPREMFQRVGTEAFRGEFGSDFWVRRLQITLNAQLPLFGMFVVTDVRYNGKAVEADWIRSQGGAMVHVRGPQRRGDVSTQRVSNVELPVLPGDYILDNFGGLDELRHNVKTLLNQVLVYNNPNKEQSCANAQD